MSATELGRDAICLAIVVLSLWRLGSQPLRLDEARTALLADEILRRGIPRVDLDRPPLFGRVELNARGTFVLHTPLQFYVAALARWVRPTPFATRLPFAVIGAASCVGAAVLADRLAPNAGVFTAALLMQTGVLLLIRQARYYPLVMAWRVLALCGLVMEWPAAAAAAGVLIALTEWSGFLATLAASLVAASFGAWSFGEPLALSAGLVVLPVWLWARRGATTPAPLHRDVVAGFVEAFWTYVWKLQCHLVPVIPVAAVALVVRPDVPLPIIGGLAWVVLGHIGLRALSPAVFTRYLAAAVPPLAVALGIVLAGIYERAPVVAVGLTAVTMLTNALHVGVLAIVPRHWVRRVALLRCPGGTHYAREAPEDADLRVRVVLWEFVRELRRSVPLRVEGLVRWLPPGSRVVIGQTEAPTLKAAAPHLDVVPWGLRRAEERAWLREHPPDVIIIGDLDRTAAVLPSVSGDFCLRRLPVTDLLVGNGETLERHVFDAAGVPVGVEVLERCSP